MTAKLEIGIEVVPSHAFGRAFVEGVAQFAARQKDWKLRALQQDTATAKVLRACDGIIMRAFGDKLDRLAGETGIPIVDIMCERRYPHLAQIHIDESACGHMAADFFLSRGYTRFGFCGIANTAYSNSFQEAFCRHVQEAGFAPLVYEPPAHLAGDAYDNPYRAPDAAHVKRWLKALPKPIAVCCSNDNRAYQVMQQALKADIAIPSELALLGCDNDAMLCTFAPVPISSIDSDATKLGFSAARMLNAMIRQQPRDKPHPVMTIAPKALVERDSTEFFPIDPPWLSDALLLIDRDLSRGISACDVFRASGYSPPHVENVFREKLGKSVQDYIVAQRMNRARSLLADRTKSAKEVAFACGYASPQYFSRAFRECFGKTPKAWANSNSPSPLHFTTEI